MTIPTWALTLSYWLHMLATVVWLGGLASTGFLTLPLIQQLEDTGARLEALARVQRRLDPLGWFSLLLLTGTGLLQMSASERYDGFLTFQNLWSQAILLKHIVFLGMVAVSGYLTWSAIPALSRAVLRTSLGKGETDEAPRLIRVHVLLLRINLALGGIVLVFTALARAAA